MDLSGVKPDGNPVNVRVDVTTVDPRVTILEVRPRSIQVVLDQMVPKTVQVVVDVSDPPDGLQLGEIDGRRRPRSPSPAPRRPSTGSPAPG